MKAILKINGKEIEVEVSEAQIDKMTKKKKSPFARASCGDNYYYIELNNTVGELCEIGYKCNKGMFDVANYCTDKDLIQQQAYRETLNRLLWRWQFENDEPCDFLTPGNKKWSIYFDCACKDFYALVTQDYKEQSGVYFSTREKAEQAIEEVVKPFMEEHPDFVW